MKVHPVFHNSLIKPYTETVAHGPNFELPPPEIIEGEEGHYEIEKILMSRPTRNRKSTQYLVKWKGYPDSENSSLTEQELTHAQELLTKFHKPRINNIAGAMGPKEGILSRAKRATTLHPENIRTINPSPQNPALKRSYSQVVQTRKPTRDPEKQARDYGKTSPDQSRDLSILSTSYDPGIRARDHTWSRGVPHFARATHPLNNTWQTMGTCQRMTK